MFGRLLGGTLFLHFRGSCPNGILPGAKFTLRPCLAFSYIDSVTARRSSSGRQPNCGVVSTCDRVAIPFDTGAVELSTVILYRNMCENATGLGLQ